jgi:hypothetical protein
VAPGLNICLSRGGRSSVQYAVLIGCIILSGMARLAIHVRCLIGSFDEFLCPSPRKNSWGRVRPRPRCDRMPVDLSRSAIKSVSIRKRSWHRVSASFSDRP